LDGLLSHIADQIAEYVKFQIDSGADCIMMFDSWGGQLPPKQWDRWSRPYIERIVRQVKASHPSTPLTLYANGSGGMLERMGQAGADVIGLDWTVDMADARRRLGPEVAVQVRCWQHSQPVAGSRRFMFHLFHCNCPLVESFCTHSCPSMLSPLALHAGQRGPCCPVWIPGSH
jgi:hypothetical protein